MEKPGQCPFLKQECVQDRCSLWGQVNLPSPGPLSGMVKTSVARGCVFNLLVLLLSTPRPVVVVNPQAGRQPPS